MGSIKRLLTYSEGSERVAIGQFYLPKMMIPTMRAPMPPPISRKLELLNTVVTGKSDHL